MFNLRWIDLLAAAAILGTIVFTIGLIGYWRANSRRNSFLKQMRGIQKSLREIQANLHALQVNLRQNQILKHEPYLSRVKTLEVELTWLDFEFSSVRDQYIQVHEMISLWEKFDRLNYLISLLPGSEYDRLMQTATSFAPRILILNEYLENALEHTQEIAELGWEIAGNIRIVIDKFHDCQRILQTLLERHVHGGYIDDANIIVNRVFGQISLIPQELIENSKENIINQTEYATVCEVHEIYQEILPVIENLQLRLNQWWDEYQLADRAIHTCLSTLLNTQGLIQESSERIDLENLLDNFKTIQSIGDILKDTLDRVEIESLPEMVQEAERIDQTALETADTVKQARRNQSILEPLVEQIEAGIDQINQEISSLRKHATFPVVWDKTGKRFNAVKKRYKEITVVGRLRSPDEIQDHLTIALNLYKEIVALMAHIKQTKSIHEALTVTFNTEEIEQGLYWSQEARRIIDIAETYDPANYPKNLSVHQIALELDETQKKHQDLLNRLFSHQIRETDLAGLLEEMRSLLDSYSLLREQVSEVKSYLNIFREEINQAREILQKNQPVLNQMTSIIRSNSLLAQQGVEKEVDRIKKNLEIVSNKVNNVSIGTVQNKRLATQEIDHRVELTCARWINYIQKNIDFLRNDLRQKLEKLDGMANLDDVVIKQARKLLTQTIEPPKDAAGTSNTNSGCENPVLPLKTKNDLWQNLIATSNEFEEMVYQPICEAYEEVLTQKKLATNELELAGEYIPEKRGWPATSFVMPVLRSNLATIDMVREKNISQPMRAIWWMKRFAEISIKYQEFCHYVTAAVETSKHDLQVITELEQQLDALDQKWSDIELQMANDRMASAKIRALKKDVEQQYKQIKRRWQFSGSVPGIGPSFGEIQNALLELVDRFQTTVVVVSNSRGENLEIGIRDLRETHS